MVAFDYAADPDIKRALDAGWTLDEVADPETQARLGEAIRAAAEKYGPRSDEMREAIDAANAAAVMLTSARAAYERMNGDAR